MSISADTRILPCETCGQHFVAATMFHVDFEPECGDCQNDRLRKYIDAGWTSEADPSEPCPHDNAAITPIAGSPVESMWCPDCEQEL
jgi:hypothetical protein